MLGHIWDVLFAYQQVPQAFQLPRGSTLWLVCSRTKLFTLWRGERRGRVPISPGHLLLNHLLCDLILPTRLCWLKCPRLRNSIFHRGPEFEHMYHWRAFHIQNFVETKVYLEYLLCTEKKKKDNKLVLVKTG